MTMILDRLERTLSALALAALVAAVSGCASKDPNAASYHFPGEGGTAAAGQVPGGNSSQPTPPSVPGSSASPAPNDLAPGAPASNSFSRPPVIMASSMLRVGDMINVS